MNKALPKPRMASVDQTAALLGLSVPTVYRMIERAQLDTVKVGRRRLIRMTSIEALTGDRDQLLNMLALSIFPAPARAVAILPAGDGLVAVLPLPKGPTDPRPQQFDDVDDARLFAAGLALAKGWTINDLTGVPE